MTITINFFDQRSFTDFTKVENSTKPESKVEEKQVELQPTKKSKKRITKK